MAERCGRGGGTQHYSCRARHLLGFVGPPPATAAAETPIKHPAKLPRVDLLVVGYEVTNAGRCSELCLCDSKFCADDRSSEKQAPAFFFDNISPSFTSFHVAAF